MFLIQDSQLRPDRSLEAKVKMSITNDLVASQKRQTILLIFDGRISKERRPVLKTNSEILPVRHSEYSCGDHLADL